MKYVITGVVAALALFVSTGIASAQHGDNGHRGYIGHSAAPAHYSVAPTYYGGQHQNGYSGYPSSGFGSRGYSAPVYGGRHGGYARPAHMPSYLIVPAYSHGPSYGHYRGHH